MLDMTCESNRVLCNGCICVHVFRWHVCVSVRVSVWHVRDGCRRMYRCIHAYCLLGNDPSTDLRGAGLLGLVQLLWLLRTYKALALKIFALSRDDHQVSTTPHTTHRAITASHGQA